MRMTFGKHWDVLIEILILKHPEYTSWLLNQAKATGKLAEAQTEAIRLIQILDRKPLVVNCRSSYCDNPATKLTAYAGNAEIAPWCDECNPCSSGSSRGKLSQVRTYCDVLNQVRTSSSRPADFASAIKALAQLKGLPARVGEAQAIAFFE